MEEDCSFFRRSWCRLDLVRDVAARAGLIDCLRRHSGLAEVERLCWLFASQALTLARIGCVVIGRSACRPRADCSDLDALSAAFVSMYLSFAALKGSDILSLTDFGFLLVLANEKILEPVIFTEAQGQCRVGLGGR